MGDQSDRNFFGTFYFIKSCDFLIYVNGNKLYRL